MNDFGMFLPTPSPRHNQDTLHVLVRCFREIYTNESVTKEKVQNLVTSKYGDHCDHDVYVERLEAIQMECNSKMKKMDDLLSHLKETLCKARSLEQKEFEDQQTKYKTYSDLGLPPVASKLSSFLNKIALKEHSLIVLSDSEHTDETNNQTKVSATVSHIPPDDFYFPQLCVATKDERKAKTDKNGFNKDPTNDPNNNMRSKCLLIREPSKVNKNLLEIQKTSKFLKNPRFADMTTTSTKKHFSGETIEIASNEFFKPIPCPLVFRNCQAGGVYEMKLELKNISSSSRQVRVFQPATKFFSLGLGDFPSANGVVAPGMSCQFTVKFMPDTLSDYSDVLVVKTHGCQSMLVPLEGQRDKPLLNLPQSLDCGYSLINGKKVITLKIENKGGNGRFFFKEDQIQSESLAWDEIDFSDCSLTVKPFTICPSYFQINSSQKITLTVLFEPITVKHFSQDIFLFCDDCSLTRYTLTGTSEVAQISIKDIEGGFTCADIDEMIDKTAEQIINFGRNYPNDVSTRVLFIKNEISVPLPFHWIVHFPQVRCREETSNDILNSKASSNNRSVFKVLPEYGILKENDLTKFSIQFSPLNVGQFYDVAALFLENIPNASGENTLENPVKLSVKGFAEAVTVLLEPAILVLSGKLFIGMKYHRTIKLKNVSQCISTFRWTKIISNECIVEISPEEGQIGNNEFIECLVSVEGKHPSSLKCDVKYEVPFSSADRFLHIEATFNGPNVSFIENVLDFELLRVGTYSNKCVTLLNCSPIPAHWMLFKMDEDVDLPLVFFPEKGVIEPNGKQIIAFHFYPQFASSIESYICCHVDNGPLCYLPIQAEVQRPHVYAKQSLVIVGPLFLDVPFQATISIVNSTFLTAYYAWSFEGKGVNAVFQPQSGEIASYEEVHIVVSITCSKIGDKELTLLCEVADMLEPVVVVVSASVKGLAVDVLVPDVDDFCSGSEHICYKDALDFGINIPLGEVQKAYLIVENKSAIKTAFSLQAENFYPARIPSPPPESLSQSKRNRSLFLKTDYADLKNKSTEPVKQDPYDELANGKGVVFICSPNAGELDAFEKKTIVVTALSDMWGDYKDFIVLNVPNLEKQFVPVHIDVVGCPLDFQMSRGQTTAVVRFGSHVSGDKEVLRKILVNNNSYVDIRLDWQTYFIDPRIEKLVDLNVYIGDPFPLLNEDTNEDSVEAKVDGPLIRITLGEHHGVRSDVPFNIKTKQMIVLGKSHAHFEIGFQPPTGVNKEVNFVGYALGYMSLNEKDRVCGIGMKRMNGLDMLPFSINMTGAVKPSQILITSCDDDFDYNGFLFRLSSADLLTKDSVSCIHRFILLNNSGVVLSFSCQIEQPFTIVKFGENKQKARTYTLSPNKNVELHISFDLTRELAISLHKSRNDSNLEVLIEKQLVIKFSNQVSQTYCLAGQVIYPHVAVQKKNFNFDTCFVGEQIEDILSIHNPSKTDLHWELYKDLNSPDSINKVFEISQTSGTISCETPNAGGNDSEVKIKFAPAHAVEYECDVFVRSVIGHRLFNELPLKITLRGGGSYDEAYMKSSLFP